MSKKIPLGAAISFMAIVAAVTFTITMIFANNTFNQTILNVKEREEMYNKLAEVDQLVRQNYVGDIDEVTLLDSINEGYLDGIGDPYAAYYSVEATRTVEQIQAGTLIGIGVVTSDASGYLRVQTVYEDSPAALAGIQKSDLIVKVGDQDIKSLDKENSEWLLYGEPGTTVSLTIRRENVDSVVEMQRKNYTVPVVEYTLLDDVAYIRLYDFTSEGVAAFKSALDRASSDGAAGLVFDLRNNTSRDLDSAASMLDYLLPTGNIYSLTYKDGTKETLRKSNEEEVTLPMAVLMNSSTACAAELFAADLHDFDKAKLVGETTAGKGAAQSKFTLKDGSSFYMTNAYWNAAVTQEINGVGVAADYEVHLSAEQAAAFSTGELLFEDDPQMIKAQEVLNVLKS